MKKTLLHYQILTLCILLFASPFAFADADADMALQKSNCEKNSANEWSASMNKCIGKKAAIETRREADSCNSIADLSSRENCHKALAEKKSGLSANPDSLYQGNTTGSMLMNTAYSVVSLINFTGKSGSSSKCTSKTIFGVTAVAGLASDAYLKYKAKSKVKELAGKYKLDVKSNASDSQVKALEYLKEEQNTVAEIASLEKKRNLLLMMGYGAAAAMAAWELTLMGKNPDCVTGIDNKDAAKTETAPVQEPILEESNTNR